MGVTLTYFYTFLRTLLSITKSYSSSQCRNQPLLQGEQIPFIEEWCLETKIWCQVYFLAMSTIASRIS